VAALQARVRALDDAYHNTSSPAASDAEYDALKGLLRREVAALRASAASGRRGGRRTNAAASSDPSSSPDESEKRRVERLLDSSPLKSVGAPVPPAAAAAGKTTAKRRKGTNGSNNNESAGAAAAAAAAAAPSQPAAKVRHPVRMLSLEAVQSVEAARRWGERTGRQLEAAAAAAGVELPPPPSPPESRAADGGGGGGGGGGTGGRSGGAEERVAWVLEPKVDGLALRLTYRGGELAAGATRGDGDEGEDVTAAALAGALAGAPLRFSPPPSDEDAAEEQGEGAESLNGAAAAADEVVEVLGEAYLTADAFAALNSRRAAEGLGPFGNARNAAAGSLRLSDASAAAARGLSFVAYGLARPGASPSVDGSRPRPGPLGETHWACLEWLRARGFAVSAANARPPGGFSAALSAAGAWMRGRGALPYEADGAVLKLDDLRLRALLGEGRADPRWAVAIKFPAGEAVGRLLRVDVAVGRSGAVTPVAVLEPVRVGGVTVTRASLHNAAAAAALGLRAGDAVVVSRRGDVIPQVERVVEGARTGREGPCWRAPERCPHCGAGLVQAASAASAAKVKAAAAAGGDGGGGGVGGGGAADVAAAATEAVTEAAAAAQGKASPASPAPSAPPPLPPLLFCPNRSGCPAQAQRALEHYASVACGAGLGPATLRALREAGLARDPADLYTLLVPPLSAGAGAGAAAAAADADADADPREKSGGSGGGAGRLAALPRFGPLKAAAALAAVQASRAAPARTVLAALGVPHVGQLTADRLAAAFGDLRGVRDAALSAAREEARRQEAAEALAAEEERRWEDVETAEAAAAALEGGGGGGGGSGGGGGGSGKKEQQKRRQQRRKQASTAAAAAAALVPAPGETARLLRPGMAVGDALREWFADEDNAGMLQRLAEGGVRAAASLLLPAGEDGSAGAAAAAAAAAGRGVVGAAAPSAGASASASASEQPPQLLAGEQIVVTGALAGPEAFGGESDGDSDSDSDEDEEDEGGAGDTRDSSPKPGMPRCALADLIEALGGRLRPSVTRGTSLVVVGSGARRRDSAKAREAGRLGVPVVGERAFWRRLRRGGWTPP